MTIKKDCAELCDMAKYFDARGVPSNGDFLRGISAKYQMAEMLRETYKGDYEKAMLMLGKLRRHYPKGGYSSELQAEWDALLDSWPGDVMTEL